MSTVKRSCRTCGWHGTYSSAAKGDYAKRQHSCARHLHKAEAAARREAREATVDRTPKPCSHPHANHVHGTYAAYVLDRCRCHDCKRANSRYENQRAKKHAYGRFTDWVPAEPARQHVRALMAAGMGLKTIAKTPGISHGQLWKLIYGKKKPDGTRTPGRRIHRDTEARILAVEPDLADGARIGPTGTTRRLQGLVAIGWSMNRLSQRLGMKLTNARHLFHGTGQTTVARARQVAALYDELWNQLPPHDSHRDKIAYSRARNHAKRLGWAPPLAWDDSTIDDPAAQPAPWLADADAGDIEIGFDEAAVQRAVDGDHTVRLTKADRVEIINRLHARRWTDQAIARRTGISDKTVLRLRHELDLPAITPEEVAS